MRATKTQRRLMGYNRQGMCRTPAQSVTHRPTNSLPSAINHSDHCHDPTIRITWIATVIEGSPFKIWHTNPRN